METSNAVGSQYLLSYDEFMAATGGAGSGAGGAGAVTPGAGASASQAEALALLSVLDLALPANDAGHGVTTDPELKGRLLAFLGLDPSDQAASLKAAVESGTVTDEQYSQIADMLRTQSGAAPAPAGPPADVQDDPALAISAETAAAVIYYRDSVFIANPRPAEPLYRFTFAGPQGKALKDWIERSGDGICRGIPRELYEKVLNGEYLTEGEYKQVWKAIRDHLYQNGGEDGSALSRETGRRVIAVAADDGTTKEGYLVDEDWKLYWIDAAGQQHEIVFPKEGDDSTVAPAGIVMRGTSAELQGDYSVPEDKRQGVIDFLLSLPPSDSNNQLIEAVRSGKLSAEQRYRIIQLADQAIAASNPGQAGADNSPYADHEEFSQATGVPVYSADQYEQWL